MPDNPYYGFKKEATEGTAIPNPELLVPTRRSSSPLLNQPSNPNLDITIGHSNESSLWSLLSRLFRRKSKPPVRILDWCELPIWKGILLLSVKVEYEGKKYEGMLYPVKDEESNA